MFCDFDKASIFFKKTFATFFANHTSHDMFPFCLFVVDFFLEDGAVGVEPSLKFFNKFALFLVFLFIVHGECNFSTRIG